MSWAQGRDCAAAPATERCVNDTRGTSDLPHALLIGDPSPVANVPAMWAAASQAALIGIFLLLFGTFLYFGRPLVLPVLAAAVVALTLARGVKAAADRGCPPVVSALVILLVVLGAISLIATAIAGPVSAWIGRAPEIGASLKQKFSVFDQPLAALHQLQTSLFGSDNGLSVNEPVTSVASNVVLPVVAFVTPAAGELLLFFVMLFFFLVGQHELRTSAVGMFSSRDAKLRFLKIMRDIERNLAGYLVVVTMVNAALGTVVALGVWLVGLPNPVIFGVLAAVFNYVPYIGPAIMVIVLFGVGLVTFPSISHAVIAPLGLIALSTAEGHFITPTIIGRRLTLNPLLVFLTLAFWTWMWGPIGAFLAVPLCIIGLVISNHLIPPDDVRLPD
jgi:predicted PurR-regulated permease PerM